MSLLATLRTVTGLQLLRLGQRLTAIGSRWIVGHVAPLDEDRDDGGPVGVELSPKARAMRASPPAPAPRPRADGPLRGSIQDRINVARRGALS